MAAKAPPFILSFEMLFLESYELLGPKEKRTIDKAVKFLAQNPRHSSLNVHKAKNIKAKYAGGGDAVFIAYAGKGLRFTFEHGPDPGMISLRNCGFHDDCEAEIQQRAAGKYSIDSTPQTGNRQTSACAQKRYGRIAPLASPGYAEYRKEIRSRISAERMAPSMRMVVYFIYKGSGYGC